MLKLKKPLNISQISSVRESPQFYMFYLRKKQTNHKYSLFHTGGGARHK